MKINPEKADEILKTVEEIVDFNKRIQTQPGKD